MCRSAAIAESRRRPPIIAGIVPICDRLGLRLCFPKRIGERTDCRGDGDVDGDVIHDPNRRFGEELCRY
jgi:hypothetical protein